MHELCILDFNMQEYVEPNRQVDLIYIPINFVLRWSEFYVLAGLNSIK